MADKIYHAGDIIPFTVEFTDPANSDAKVDPTTVGANLKSPAWGETTITLTKTAVGVYEGLFEATTAGPWTVSAHCSGGYKGTEPKTFQVLGAFG